MSELTITQNRIETTWACPWCRGIIQILRARLTEEEVAAHDVREHDARDCIVTLRSRVDYLEGKR